MSVESRIDLPHTDGVHAPSTGIRLRPPSFENPVMIRELRSRMRGARSYVIILIYALTVSTFVLAAYAWLSTERATSETNRLAAEMGRAIWMWGCAAQAGLLPLLVPGFTCGAITIEREKELFDLLLLTRLTPAQICAGKLGSGVVLGLMLVLCSVPVLALSAFLGGVSPGEMAASVVVLVTSVLASGALGLAASSVAPRTASATILAYSVVGFGMVGLPLLGWFLSGAAAVTSRGSELGILLTLLGLVLLAFPPAVGAALCVQAVRLRRGANVPDRASWMLITGLCWAALLLLLYVPGVSAVLLQGGYFWVLHPVAAIVGLMAAGGGSPIGPHVWVLCSVVYTGAALWLFLIAVLRVRGLRAR